MKRTMQMPSLLMWRAVRDSKPNGLGFDALRAAGGVATANADFRLKYLCSRGYLVVQRTPDPVWHLGEKLPTGESWAPGAVRVAADANAQTVDEDDEGDDEADTQAARKAVPRGVPPGVANSVWAVGGLVAQEVGALTSPADALAVASAATAAHTTKVAPGKDASPSGTADLSSWRAPATQLVMSMPPAVVQRARSTGPCFALRSDNVLVIDLAGDNSAPIQLPPDATRALFRWLDRLTGTDLASLTEEAAL